MNMFLPKDLIIKIGVKLDLSGIFELSMTDKKLNKLIQENIFWMNKFYFDYKYYPENIKSWSELYKYVTNIDPDDLLWEGVEKNNLNYVIIGLIRGANISKRTKRNSQSSMSVLDKACRIGNLEIVKYLVEQGADITGNKGEPIRNSILSMHVEITKYLLKRGAFIYNINSALKWAIKEGGLEMVKCLVEQGADIYDDEYEPGPLAIAYENGHSEIVAWINNL